MKVKSTCNWQMKMFINYLSHWSILTPSSGDLWNCLATLISLILPAFTCLRSSLSRMERQSRSWMSQETSRWSQSPLNSSERHFSPILLILLNNLSSREWTWRKRDSIDFLKRSMLTNTFTNFMWESSQTMDCAPCQSCWRQTSLCWSSNSRRILLNHGPRAENRHSPQC